MRTPLPSSITSVPEAQAFLKALYDNNESFHPDENALEIIHSETDQPLFTVEEAIAINALLDQISELKDFNPCEYLNSLHNL